ncbi:MAG: hypothetical protein JW940_26495 [Polyangiaceae bacterium]|nr:hypothetical protein [Polyangiaceae bacterium]
MGVAFMYVPLGKSREIALWGGAPNGKPLWVDLNDCGSAACPAKCVEKNNVAGAYRFFTITARRAGNSMLEARAGGPHGALWDSVQVVVERPIAWGATSRSLRRHSVCVLY